MELLLRESEIRLVSVDKGLRSAICLSLRERFVRVERSEDA